MTPDPLHPSNSPGPLNSSFKGIVISLVCVAVGVAYFAWGSGPAENQRFIVPKGASTRWIAKELKTAHLISSQLIFRGWAKILGSREALRPGVYLLTPDRLGLRIYRQLRRGPPLMRVTFPEGWTSKQMAQLLEEKGVTQAAEFLAIVEKDKREGFLFPDTYFLGQGLNAATVIERMVRRFHEAEPPDMLAQSKALKLTYRQIVILASLVEREARLPAERPLIAGVFYNRLRKRMRLESCATVEYALGAWKPQLTYKDLAVESPYNTYKHRGLPPGPICNPGKLALEAAAHPAQTDMLFFVAGGDGTHRFSKDYQEHLNVQKHPKTK